MRVVAALRSSPYADLSNKRQAKGWKAYGGVSLLGLACLAGEDDQLGLIGLQPLDVKSFALLAQVPPPVIDDDANTTGLLPTNACLLQFSQSESTSLPELSVIADRWGTNGGSE
jgi:hypothetical protein